MNPKRNPVGWFEIHVQDMNRARRFYENVFRVTLQRLDSPDGMPVELWAFPMGMDVPGASGALVKMEGSDSGGGGTIVYFSCADCAEETALAAAHGGRIQFDKMPIGEYGFCSVVYDTEGNRIGLHSMR